MQKVSYILLLITIVFTMFGCETQEQTVKKISDDNLEVRHWHSLSEDRKREMLRNILDEENINMTEKGYEDYINHYKKVLDGTLEKNNKNNRNLKESIIEMLDLS
jgi:hypothetical protein